MRAIRRTYSYVPIPLLIRGLTSTVLFHHDYYYYYPGLIARIISLSPSKLGFAAPPPNFRPQPENSTPTRVLVPRPPSPSTPFDHLDHCREKKRTRPSNCTRFARIRIFDLERKRDRERESVRLVKVKGNGRYGAISTPY